MKKIISMILSVIIVVSLAVPTFASPEVVTAAEIGATAEKESGLEEALKFVKRNFDIPEGAKFENYSVYEQNGEKVWYLNWRNSENDVSMSVNLMDSGKITGYNYYKPYDYSEIKFPKVTEEEALEKAKDFIRLVAPEGTLAKIEKQDSVQNPLTNHFYYFNFYRSIAGVPFYTNNINISVNSETGEIYNYNYNMEDNLVFPDAKQVISLEAGEKAYAEMLGLKLIYQYSYDSKDKKVNIYPTYVPKFDNSRYAIDAITGEKIQTGYPYYGMYKTASDQNLMAEKEAVRMAAGDRGGPMLTPEELDAAKEQSILLSEKDAEKIARKILEIGLDENFKLRNWNLNRNWPIQNEYIYYLNFVKEIKETTETNEANQSVIVKYPETIHASVTINAKTGEVLSFYTGNSYDNNEGKPKFDKDSAKIAVEEFLKNFIGEKFEQVEFQEPENYNDYYASDVETEPQRYFSFSYTRKVNDILFPGNTIDVGFNAVNGQITNFNMTWFNVDFPRIENVISIEEANKALLEKIGLELQYKKIEKQDIALSLPTPEPVLDDKTEIKLVYVLKSGKPFVLDANTGDIIDYSGKPYKEQKPAEYMDLSGHFAEKQIIQLAKYSIINFEGSEFKPNDKITQKDFLMILSKLMNKYYIPFITGDSSQDEIDEMYKQLVREGIVKDGEKAPDAAVLREDAVKFMIRVLKYDKVAEIQGIFSVPFKDADDITSELKGYVAIASGLKIISGAGGNFNPKNSLTRGETAMMIYNFLN